MFPTKPPMLGALSNPLAAAPMQGAVQVTGKMPPMGALQQSGAPAVAKKAPSPFDKENRRRTFLAMAQAFGSNKNFFGGLGDAAGNIGAIMDDLKVQQKKLAPEIGGPDNSFEITTDPETGKRSYVPIPVLQEYKAATREKPKDTADLAGRAMYALQYAPEGERASRYNHMVQNPEVYGMEKGWLPEQYDPQYVATRASMGSNVSQSRTRATADRALETRTDQAERRLGIYGERSAALTEQGRIRTGLAVTKANAPKAPPSTRRGSSGGGGRGKPSGGTTRPGGPTGLMMRVRKKK